MANSKVYYTLCKLAIKARLDVKLAFRNANCVGLNEALGSLPCKRISELNSLKIPLNLQNGQA